MKLVSTRYNPQVLGQRGERLRLETTGAPTGSSVSHRFSHLAVLELLQADSADGTGVGAAGRPPGSSLAVGARAALRAVGLRLQAADGLPGLLVHGVLKAQRDFDLIHLRTPGGLMPRQKCAIRASRH